MPRLLHTPPFVCGSASKTLPAHSNRRRQCTERRMLKYKQLLYHLSSAFLLHFPSPRPIQPKRKKRRSSFHLTTQFLRYVSVEPRSARVRADICIVFRALSSNVSPDRMGAKTDHNKKGGTRILKVKSAPRGKKKKKKETSTSILGIAPAPC